jgi:hypothetical protein
MPNVSAVIGNDVYVPTVLKKANGLLFTNPLEALYCPYGFLLPTETISLNLIDILNGTSSYDANIDLTVVGTLLTHDGTLYEYYLNPIRPSVGTGLRMRRYATGVGGEYIRSNSIYLEEQTTMLQHLVKKGYVPSLLEGFKMMAKSTPGQSSEMTLLHRLEIMAELVARGYTKPVPTHIVFHDLIKAKE